MKAVVLAGGFGTRLSEATHLIPKPMIEIGGRPILWHILKHHAAHGIRDFVVCCGYKGYVVKEWFANYALHVSDVTFDLERRETTLHGASAEPWRVTLVDTGEETMTGGRLLRVRDHLADGEPFCFTYGDGLSDVDLGKEIAYHRSHGRLATVTAVRPPGRFGVVSLEEDRVVDFHEKALGGDGWINGGFFVLEKACLDRIEGDATSWERDVLVDLARADQLRAYRHEGFWQPMDTLRERNVLEELWRSGRPPWRVW